MMPNSTQPHGKTRFAAVVALTAVLLLSGTLPATSQVKAEDGPTITPNYKDADLSQIIQAVSEVTGKNFIIDPRVNAKVTMLSATPMSPAAFYEAFLSVLQVYGYVAVPAGKVIKIVPNTDARQLPANDLPNNVSSTSDEIVTQVITLKNVSAAVLVPMLRPLIPQYGHLAPYAAGNMLIISDRASNVSRLVRIIERIDEGGVDQPVEVIALHNASAADVVRIVTFAESGTRRRGRRCRRQGRSRRTHQQHLADRREQNAAPPDQGFDRQYGHAARKRRGHPGQIPALCRRRKDLR